MHKSQLQLDTSYRQIIALTLPISLALVIPFLNLSINNYFLGRLGESELGTAGLTGVFFLIVAVIGNGLNNALQSIIARKAGEDKPGEIGVFLRQGIQVAILFSVIAIALTYLIVPILFDSIIHEAAVKERAIDFILIRVWGLPFLYLFQSGNALLVGTSNTRYLTIGTICQAGSNILFDYWFIFGHGGFPAMGFNGAAWASILSEGIGMLVVAGVIYIKKLHIQFEFFKTTGINKTAIKRILKTSAPLIGQYSISLISWFLFYALIEHKGERALAISNLMRNLFVLTGIFTWAFASASNTLISNTIGQGNEKEVMPLMHRIMRLSFLFAFIVCIFLNVFPHFIFALFKIEESFIVEAIPVLRIVTFGFLLMSISVVSLNAVTGTGNTTVNLFAEIASIVVYVLYIYFVIEWQYLGLPVAWGSEIIYWLVILFISYLYMYRGKWKTKLNLSSLPATDLPHSE